MAKPLAATADARTVRDAALGRLDEADTLVFRIMRSGGSLGEDRFLGAGVAQRSTRRCLALRVLAAEADADVHAVRKNWNQDTLQQFRGSELFVPTLLLFAQDTCIVWQAGAQPGRRFGPGEALGWQSRNPVRAIDRLAALPQIVSDRLPDGSLRILGTSTTRRGLVQRALRDRRRSHDARDVVAHLAENGSIARISVTGREPGPRAPTTAHLVLDEFGPNVELPLELDDAEAHRLLRFSDVGDEERGDWAAIRDEILRALPTRPR